MTTLINDLKFAFRMMRKHPGFTAIALITLAIGIGANTIMLSMVNVLLLRPTQVKNADQLVICTDRPTFGAFPYSIYTAMRNENPAFSDLMAYDPDFRFVTLERASAARRAYAMFVSANYFSFLGVRPACGRGFLPDEEAYGADPVVVLSHRAWQRQGGDPDLVGSQVSVNGTLCEVIGIAPKGFTGTTLVGPDLWLPVGTFGLVARVGRTKHPRMSDEYWNYPGVVPTGRLEQGMTRETAQARLQGLVPRLRQIQPKGWRFTGKLYLERPPRLSTGSGGNDTAFLAGSSGFLMSVSSLVLLIACLNLANMMIVQGTSRQREIAIRMAIGGGRLRIIRQLLVESLVLASCGGALGLLLAAWGTWMLNAWMALPQFELDVAGSLRVGLDFRVLAGTLGFCVIAAVLSGMKPALRLSRRDMVCDLKQSGSEVIHSSGKMRQPRGLSVVCQIAFSVVLVMGAALFTRSALNTAPGDSSFTLHDKLVVELDPRAAGYDLTRSQQVYETLVDHLRSIAGVRAASVSASFPLAEGGSGVSVREYAPARPVDQRSDEQVLRDLIAHPPVDRSRLYTVGNDYFEAVGMPLLQGRPFRPLDRVPEAEKVVIVDEALARTLRPDGNALGCLVEYGWRPSPTSLPGRVIGIVSSLHLVSDDQVNCAQIYEPMGAEDLPAFILLRMDTQQSVTSALLQRLREEIRKVDSHIPIVSVMTLAERHRNDPFVWLWGFGARLAVLLGGMALFLATLGIYAVKGYMVASRTPEIGIRKALGATHTDIVGMVLREGAILTLVGLGAGLLLGLSIARLIASLFYGVSPIDPISVAVTIFLLALSSLLAGWFPAWRAARIDPMEALRYE